MLGKACGLHLQDVGEQLVASVLDRVFLHRGPRINTCPQFFNVGFQL